MAFTTEMAQDALDRLAALIAENKELLSDLDSEVGDGDHGINMNRGIRRTAVKLRAAHPVDLGAFYRAVSLKVMDAVGGSSGPLYGVFFMRLAEGLAGKSEVSTAELAVAMRDGLESVKRLGRSAVGDKTMVDALEPAIDALAREAPQGDAAAWDAAVRAAEAGMMSTVEIEARRGRGVCLGAATIGHRDPGATSAFFMFETLRDACAAQKVL